MEGSSFYDKAMETENASSGGTDSGTSTGNHVQPSQISPVDIQSMINAAVEKTTASVLGSMSKRDAEEKLAKAESMLPDKINDLMKIVKEDKVYQENEEFRAKIDDLVNGASQRAVHEYVEGNTKYLNELEKMAAPMLAANKAYMDIPIESAKKEPEGDDTSIKIDGVPDAALPGGVSEGSNVSNLTDAEIAELRESGFDPKDFDCDRTEVEKARKNWGNPNIKEVSNG